MTNAKNAKSLAARIATLKAHRLAATSDDMNAVLGNSKSASVFAFTPAVNDTIEAWGIDTASIFATDRNPKVIKRFIQFVHGVNAKDYKAIDKTTATIIYALHLTDGMPLTTDALQYLAAGLKTDRVSPETKGVSRMTLNKLFGSVGKNTIETQCSRTVGKNGFLQLMGATVGEPKKQNQRVTLTAKHPAIVAFFNTMNAATQGQIDTMIAPKGE